MTLLLDRILVQLSQLETRTRPSRSAYIFNPPGPSSRNTAEAGEVMERRVASVGWGGVGGGGRGVEDGGKSCKGRAVVDRCSSGWRNLWEGSFDTSYAVDFDFDI